MWLWDHIWYHKNNCNLPFSRLSSMVSPMISYTFHTFSPMISELPDIIPVIAYGTAATTALWIRGYRVSITLYLCHMMSQISWYLSLCRGTCAAGWSRLGALGSRRPTGSGLAIANVLGTGAQLNTDGHDPTHELVAVDAAQGIRHCWLVVNEKRNISSWK